VAWETKEKVEKTQNFDSLEIGTKYFPNTSLQRNASLLPVPKMGQILKEQVPAIFK
jgi:hypothetical protein